MNWGAFGKVALEISTKPVLVASGSHAASRDRWSLRIGDTSNCAEYTFSEKNLMLTLA